MILAVLLVLSSPRISQPKLLVGLASQKLRSPTSVELLAKVKPVRVVGVRAEALLVELNEPPAVSQPRLLLGLVALYTR